jgi:hypothetical protein
MGSGYPSTSVSTAASNASPVRIAHGVGLKLPDAGAHHPRAHEYPAMTSDDVDVNAGAGQESCGAFNQRAGRRDIDDSQFPSRAQPHAAQCLAGLRHAPNGTPPVGVVRRHSPTL